MDLDSMSRATPAPVPEQLIVYADQDVPAPVESMYDEPKNYAEKQGQQIFQQYVEFMQREMFRKRRGSSQKPFAKEKDFRGLEVSEQLRESKLFHQFERRKDYFHDLAFTRAINQSDSGSTVGSGRNDQRAPIVNS